MLAEAQLDYVTSARLRGEGRLFIMTREILPNITGPIIVEAPCGWATRSSRSPRSCSWPAAAGPTSRTGAITIRQMYNLVPGGIWWPTIFPALAIASLVIAINLIADSVEAVYSVMVCSSALRFP